MTKEGTKQLLSISSRISVAALGEPNNPLLAKGQGSLAEQGRAS